MLKNTSRSIAAIAACISILAACSGGNNGAIPAGPDMHVQPRTTAAVSTHKSFADFLSAQGTFCVPASTGLPDGAALDSNNCVLYVPYAPNFQGWGVATPAPYCADYTVAAVDYAGLQNQYIMEHNGGTSLGTTITGSVTEHALPDGAGGEVTVVINAHNALAWAGCDATRTLNFATSTVLFGARPDSVIAGATPALANASFRIVYTEAHVGDAFPDLIELNFNPLLQTEYAWTSMQFHATASGPLTAAYGVPNGTPGQLVVGQNGTFNQVGKGSIDGFTAEFIHITAK